MGRSFSPSAGTIDSSTESLYAAYMLSRGTYIETILSHSTNDFSNLRQIILGSSAREAFGNHRTSLMSTYVEAGREIDSRDHRSELFGSLYYSSMTEDGFRELGAGDISLLTERHKYQTLSAELGWRGSREIQTRFGKLTPQVEVALLRNFDFGDSGTTTRFVGMPDKSFIALGERFSGTAARLGIGVGYLGNSGLSVRTIFYAERNNYGEDLNGQLQIVRRF